MSSERRSFGSRSAKSIDLRSSDHGHRIRITYPLGTEGSARMARIGVKSLSCASRSSGISGGRPM